jgi:hypothetical protein
MDEAQRTRLPCVFVGDPFVEYVARHGLEPGTLAKHELRGKVPFAELLAARSREEGGKTAGVSKTTFYEWMQDQTFKAEFERQRNEIIETAFGLISQNIEKAVSVLLGLLDTGDHRLKRLTANDIIGHFLKHRELDGLAGRIERVEERLTERR